MKKHYTRFLSLSLAFALSFGQGQAQCVGGGPGGSVAFDTTIAFGVGVTDKQIKFPKFNAQSGILSCVRLVVSMVGVVNYVGMQNLSTTSSNQARFYYFRNDNMSGPGLSPALANSFNGQYGPFNLTPYDGVPNAGTDFHSISNDTVLRQVMTRTLTDSATISQFYGPAGDSLTYDYNMVLSTYASFTGDNSSSVSTSALVRFRFEYCTCPLYTLPVGLKNFSVTRQGASTAALRWEAEAGNDRYYYVVETSRDGHRFEAAATLNKQSNEASLYQYGHALKPNQSGRVYYRVRQQWLDGALRYSDVRWLDFANALSSAISLYPNPTTGGVGVKFVAARPGVYRVEISNAGGQVVRRKELRAAETELKQLDALQKGLYYVKITELATGNSCLQQLVVQ